MYDLKKIASSIKVGNGEHVKATLIGNRRKEMCEAQVGVPYQKRWEAQS